MAEKRLLDQFVESMKILSAYETERRRLGTGRYPAGAIHEIPRPRSRPGSFPGHSCDSDCGKQRCGPRIIGCSHGELGEYIEKARRNASPEDLVMWTGEPHLDWKPQNRDVPENSR